jgi:hypothetical protein
MSFLDLLEETPVEAGTTADAALSFPPAAAGAVVVPAPAGLSSRKSADDLAQEGLRAIEDSLYEQSAEVVSDALRFAELDEGNMPPEWLEKHGAARAEKMARTAQMASLPSKEAPVGLQIAQKTHAAISKARAAAGTGPKVLNMTLVQMPGANVVFPEKELKK